MDRKHTQNHELTSTMVPLRESGIDTQGTRWQTGLITETQVTTLISRNRKRTQLTQSLYKFLHQMLYWHGLGIFSLLKRSWTNSRGCCCFNTDWMNINVKSGGKHIFMNVWVMGTGTVQKVMISKQLTVSTCTQSICSALQWRYFAAEHYLIDEVYLPLWWISLFKAAHKKSVTLRKNNSSLFF